MSGRFVGKFRGVVSDIQDPLFSGRIRAKVPDVMGDEESGWALPCAPFAGDGVGLFALPSVGAGVWIEFEHGDPEYPIWSGCWWGSAKELPSQALAPPPYKKFVLKTPDGHRIILDDTPGIGGITIETSGGQKLVLTTTGIELTNGQGASVKLTGPQVSVNGGALEVT
jgi:uncharacterized protein involved in type VI secretion and phage assembly